jgi:LacI family transcriptional regulator
VRNPRSRPVIGVRFTGEHPYTRGMHSGISRYAQEHTDWDLVLSLHWQEMIPTRDLPRHYDGLLTMSGEIEPEVLLRSRLPTVFVGYRGDDRFRYVLPDHRANGEIAARHLLDRGLTRFGSFMNADKAHITLAWMHDGFESAIRASGHPVERFHNGRRAARRWTLANQLLDLQDWLHSLPKPAGIFASDDDHAWRVIEAASHAGLRVPDDLAVVGSMNAEWICDFSRPRITSVSYNQEGVGYEAARVLHRMLGARKPERGVSFGPPGEVVRRESSEVFAVGDPLVARALRFIWTDPGHDFRLPALLDHLHVSRSVLYRHFREASHASPVNELRRARLDRAKQLLLETREPLAEIAAACGFEHLSQLSREIKRATGLPPREFRATRQR